MHTETQIFDKNSFEHGALTETPKSFDCSPCAWEQSDENGALGHVFHGMRGAGHIRRCRNKNQRDRFNGSAQQNLSATIKTPARRPAFLLLRE
jgi:hypothetical protein